MQITHKGSGISRFQRPQPKKPPKTIAKNILYIFFSLQWIVRENQRTLKLKQQTNESKEKMIKTSTSTSATQETHVVSTGNKLHESHGRKRKREST